MSLFNCPECGIEISTEAKYCPYCGRLIEGQRYQNTYYHQPEQNQHSGSSGLAIASMVLGVLSLVFMCLGVGWIFGIIGIVLGLASLCRNNLGYNMALAGVITSGISLIFIVLIIFIGFLGL